MPREICDGFFGGRSEILVTTFFPVIPTNAGGYFSTGKHSLRTWGCRCGALKSASNTRGVSPETVKVLQGIRTHVSKLGPKKQNFFGQTVRSLGVGFFLKKKKKFVCWTFAEGVFFSVCQQVSAPQVHIAVPRYDVSPPELKRTRQPKFDFGYI